MLSNGSRLRNRYAIKNQLGTGLAGRTYLATDLFVPDSVCAIKELAPKHEKGSVAYQLIRKKFEEEARCLTLLKGYNAQIPKLLDEFPANDTLYIVQEYIEGHTLQSLIGRDLIEQSKVRDLLVSLLKVVIYIHSKDILHRDIKPSNIIVRSGTEIPVLIDFGSVKDLEITEVGTTIDISELAFMSKGYTAPEQLLGETVPASDVYSLGQTAVHLLSGRPPKTLSDTNWRAHAKGLLPEFAEVIDKSISPYLSQRYKHPADMLNELEKLVFPEDREKITRENSLNLAVVIERKPRPFPKISRKCDACDFVLTLENEFCPNCATYNPLKLDRESFLLHGGSPEQYFDEIVFPKADQEVQILFRLIGRNNEDHDELLWRFINEHHNETVSHWIFLNRTKIEIFAFVPLVILWGILVFNIGKFFELTPTVYWVIPIITLPAITLLAFQWLTDIYKDARIHALRARQREHQRHRQEKIRRIGAEKSDLRQELAERSKAEKQRKRDLKERERFIDNRITDVTKWVDELNSLLSEIKDDRLVDNDMQDQHAVRLKASLQIAGQIQKQYQSKKIEIGLLRINNFLQNEGNVAQMTHESRLRIKKKLKEIIEMCNRMSTNLQKADVTSTTEGSESLVRILEIGRIATKLWQHLIAQDIELALPGRTSDRSRPAPEFVKGLALLNAYVCLDDFSKELDKLEMEFTPARRGNSVISSFDF